MSGHNKWSQIKHQKAKTDSVKSRIFSKFAKLITDEARKAKGNRESPTLKTAIERARAANMPSDNIDRAIKKATEVGVGAMDSVVYEAYGPGGTAILIEVLTANRNKAAQEIKFILSENGIAMANPGSAMWAFEKQNGEWAAETTVPVEEASLFVLEKLVEALEAHEDVQGVYTNAE